MLAPAYMKRVPIDPKGCTSGGPWNAGCFSYAYGNVTADGQSFDLLAQLENTSDPGRCGVKNYRVWGAGVGGSSWCKAFGGSYSNQLYQQTTP